MVYIQDTSRNGTMLKRFPDFADPSFESSDKNLTNSDPPYLISDGDELHLSPNAMLKFGFQETPRVSVTTREQVRGLEKKVCVFCAMYT